MSTLFLYLLPHVCLDVNVCACTYNLFVSVCLCGFVGLSVCVCVHACMYICVCVCLCVSMCLSVSMCLCLCV